MIPRLSKESAVFICMVNAEFMAAIDEPSDQKVSILKDGVGAVELGFVNMVETLAMK